MLPESQSLDSQSLDSQGLDSIADVYESVVRFQESYEPPPGMSAKDFMRSCLALMNACPPPVRRVADNVLLTEVAGWQLRADVVAPVPPGTYPVIVFFHGGGWSMGSPATHRRLACDLAQPGCAVVSVDYRRLPKHRFPAQFDDAVFAVRWAADQAATYGWDAGRIILAGDSAGATLAAAAAEHLARVGGPSIRALLLFYGIFDYHDALSRLHPSVLLTPQERGQGYLPPEEYETLREDYRVSPLYGCSALPVTYISAGTSDSLFGQSQQLAAALRRAGIEHEFHPVDGAPHGFMQLPFHWSYLAGQVTVHEFLRKHAAS
jgi:acetyl esterase